MAAAGLFSTSRKMSSFFPSFSQGPGMYCASCSRTSHLRIEHQIHRKHPTESTSRSTGLGARSLPACLPTS